MSMYHTGEISPVVYRQYWAGETVFETVEKNCASWTTT